MIECFKFSCVWHNFLGCQYCFNNTFYIDVENVQNISRLLVFWEKIEDTLFSSASYYANANAIERLWGAELCRRLDICIKIPYLITFMISAQGIGNIRRTQSWRKSLPINNEMEHVATRAIVGKFEDKNGYQSPILNSRACHALEYSQNPFFHFILSNSNTD